MTRISKSAVAFASIASLALSTMAALPARAEDGVSATEIVLGGTDPFSGPASAYGAVGKGSQAYFDYVNDHGGVNMDDGYSPPQTVQATRQLVEQDKVFAMFACLGTAPNLAIRSYLNTNKVPQLFVSTGASTWGKDYAQYPWTIGSEPDYESEAVIYGRNVVKTTPNAKIGIIYQNDDFGKDYITGLTKGLGSKSSMIVKQVSYETTDPDVSSQIASLKAAGADTLMVFATPKFTIQSLAAVVQQSWKPQIYLANVSGSQAILHAAMKAAGTPAAAGLISTEWVMDPANPAQFGKEPGYKLFMEIMAKYLPGASTIDGNYMAGMVYGYMMVDALKHAGKQPTRESVMKAALNLNEDNPFLYPGIKVTTSASNHFPITSLQLVKYNGTDYVPLGGVTDARAIIKAE
jgi:branched-chain amino acid transport system substrate-binding protein